MDYKAKYQQWLTFDEETPAALEAEANVQQQQQPQQQMPGGYGGSYEDFYEEFYNFFGGNPFGR